MAPPDLKTPNELADLLEPWIERLRTRKEDGTALTGSDRKAKSLKAQFRNLSLGAPGNSAPESISISIGKANIPDAKMESFEHSIGFLSAALETARLGDIEDLDDAREALEELSMKTRAVKEYKQHQPDFKRYQVVSFSRLTHKHLADMGVTSKRLSKTNRDAILGVLNAITPTFVSRKFHEVNKDSLSVIFERFWQMLTNDGRYIKDFNVLKKGIGRKPEARARMLTDYILTQLMVFVEEQLDRVQFMFLELVLASSTKPVSITHGNTATLLTGSVDYAILSSVGTTDDVARLLKVKDNEKIHDALGGIGGENNLDDIIHSTYWRILEGFKQFKFTLIEEKRKEGRKELKDCEPQVTGEALVLQQKTRQHWVLWCLSNGEDWIFGALNDKKSRSLPPLSIDDKDVKKSIKAILKMLVIWTVCDPEALTDYLDMRNG